MFRLFPDYFAAAIAPLAYENTMTLFLPSDEALEKVSEARLNALPEMRLTEVSASVQRERERERERDGER